MFGGILVYFLGVRLGMFFFLGSSFGFLVWDRSFLDCFVFVINYLEKWFFFYFFNVFSFGRVEVVLFIVFCIISVLYSVWDIVIVK